MLHDSLKKASLSSRTERPPNNMYLISATECLKAIHHSVVHLAGHSKLRRTGEMRLLASVPVNAASPWKGCCHKSVNQFDFEVTKPRRVIVGNVRYCISRNLIRVAMFHFCYLFEGLTFSLLFGAFAPCCQGFDFTMPSKGSRITHDNRKVTLTTA